MAGGAVEPNPFFYVSSSEWNLYDYIKEFCRKNALPRGVFQLAQIKRFKDLLNTGQGRHASKYIRITRILKYFPNHKYVLLGDNSQKDPEIYATVAKDFPGLIHAVYIRNIRILNDEPTKQFLKDIESRGIPCCYFKNSSEAIEHSVKIGLIGAQTSAL
jgi:phosphatidate phosphatase APP1